MRNLLRWFAFLSAFVVLVVFLVIPAGAYQTTTSQTGGITTQASGRMTVLEASGWSELVPLSIPLVVSLLALLPWPARGRRAVDVACAAIVTVFCALVMLSVGPFFFPTALALLTVALVPTRPRPAT